MRQVSPHREGSHWFTLTTVSEGIGGGISVVDSKGAAVLVHRAFFEWTGAAYLRAVTLGVMRHLCQSQFMLCCRGIEAPAEDCKGGAPEAFEQRQFCHFAAPAQNGFSKVVE